MLLARVVGTVVASRKDEGLAGQKFLLLRDLDARDGGDRSGHVVAVDAVGVGVGEVVLYATGSAARQTRMTHERPCDGVIMAVVDTWEVDGEVVYRKTPADGEWAS